MPTFLSSFGLTCVLATGALAFFAACGNGDDDDIMPAADGGTDAAVTPAADAAPTKDAATGSGYDDAQIVKIFLTFDNGAVTEAETAETAASTEDVHTISSDIDNYYYQDANTIAEYAERVTLTPADSPDSTSLAATIAADESTYATLSGSAFDSAYVSAQISEHTAMLALIDTKLAKETTDPTLANIITAQRAQFATTLAGFQSLQADAGH